MAQRIKPTVNVIAGCGELVVCKRGQADAQVLRVCLRSNPTIRFQVSDQGEGALPHVLQAYVASSVPLEVGRYESRVQATTDLDELYVALRGLAGARRAMLRKFGLAFVAVGLTAVIGVAAVGGAVAVGLDALDGSGKPARVSAAVAAEPARPALQTPAGLPPGVPLDLEDAIAAQ